MFHRFKKEITGISLPEKFTNPFCYTPHPLCVMAVEEVQEYLDTQMQWTNELGEGKMFGVLVVQTVSGEIGYLAAFSGNLAHSNKHEFFVPPVFDLLDPQGFFVPEEKHISTINVQIEMLEKDNDYQSLNKQFAEEIKIGKQVIEKAKADCRRAKTERDRQRKLNPDIQDIDGMIRESQFQKAELKRLERKVKERIEAFRKKVSLYESQIDVLKEERKTRSFFLQKKLFDSFRFLNARGEEESLYVIFDKAIGKLPPGGAGECAAPKLLQYAYRNQMSPLAMAEFWWKKVPEIKLIQEDRLSLKRNVKQVTENDLRRHGYYYPACKNKCEPILNFMIQGLHVEKNRFCTEKSQTDLEIVFEDEWLVAVNKPAGMLSVPGKDSLDSVYTRMKISYPNATGPLIVHRLDMDTSGLMIIAKTKEVHKMLQKMFAARNVQKCYVALLDGIVLTDEGTIILPLCPNPDDRPRQVVHFNYGKPAITRYKVLKRTTSYTQVAFYPQTGRTHQLRVHSAHPEGLNAPIHGDRLYGQPAERLCLHAQSLAFVHPVTKEDLFLHVTFSEMIL